MSDLNMVNNQNRVTGLNALRPYLKGLGTILILLGMCVILSILSPSFLKVNNLLNVIKQTSIIAIIGLGETMVLITSGVDLGAGSVVGFVGVVAASFAGGQVPLVVCIIIALAAGALTGFINGFITTWGRIPPFIATLGMFEAARGLALIYSKGVPITNISNTFNFIGGGSLFHIPFPIYIMIVTAIIAHILLKHTKFGKYLYAIGGNKQAAIVSGINVNKYLVMVYTVCGMLTAVSAIVLTSRLSAGEPTAGVGYEFQAIIAAVVGGTSLFGGVGSIPGTIIGALIIGVINNGLNLLNVSPYMQQVISGILIVAAVLINERGKKKAA